MLTIAQLDNSRQEIGQELKAKVAELAVKASDKNTPIKEVNQLKDEVKGLETRFDIVNAQYKQLTKDSVDKLKSHNKTVNNSNNDLVFETAEGRKFKALRKGESFKAALNPSSGNLSIGKYIKGALTGTWKGAENEMNQFKALNTSTGATIIPKELSATIIDLSRNAIALDDILVVPMESNNLTIAKLVSDPVMSFKEELKEADFSDTTFEGVELKSKTAYGLIKISLELLNSASNIDAIITQAMSNAVANMIDKNGLYGTGGISPTGILTLPNINKIDADPIASNHYNGFIQAIGAITGNNGVPTDISYNSKIDTSLNLLCDSTGQPLNAPKAIQNLSSKVSNQVSDNQAVVYDKNSIMMGIQEQITIETSREMGFKDGSIWLRVYAMLDFVSLNDKNISLISFKTA